MRLKLQRVERDVGDDRQQQQGAFGRFFRFLGRALRNYFVTVGVLVTIGWILTIVVLVRAQRHAESSLSSAPPVHLSAEHPAPLSLTLSGKIAEREPDFTDQLMSRFFSQEKEIYLPELRAALRRASTDKRVGTMTVHFGSLAGTPADYTELRRLLADFKAGGKRLEADLPVAEDWSYYVASVADQITLNPASEIMITGPAFHLMYFAEALKKIGVDIDVVRAGKYKSAFEPFVLNAPSEATIEEYSTLQTSLMGHIVELVAAGRKKDPATVRGWYRRSIFTTDEAKAQGLIDAIGYPPDDPADEDVDADDAERKPGAPLAVSDYAEATRGDKDGPESVTDKGGIGLIEAVGEINLDSGGGTRPNEDGIAPAEMKRQLRWARSEDDVKAVVLRVSSPGGSALASDLIWHEVKELADKKPVVVSMGAYAASGGYYISAPAKYIVAEPTSITGSIGVIGMLPSVKAFEEKYGISFHVVTSSDRRNLLNLGSKATPEDKALVDSTIAQVYQGFLSRVAEGRKMPVAKVAELAQGRVYSGVQAKALGLVDELGGLQDAFKKAKSLGGLDPEKLYPVLHYEGGTMSLSECLSSASKIARCLKRGGAHASTGLTMVAALLGADAPPQAEEVAEHVKGWLAASRAGDALALWPGYLGVRWY